WNVYGKAFFVEVVVSVADVGGHKGGFEIRFGRHDVDCSRRGAAAVKRALRSFEDFDAVEIVEGREVERLTREIDVGEADCYARLAAAGNDVVADTANAEVITAEIGSGVGDVRRGELQVLRLLDLVRLQIFRREGRDRDRHVLDVFRPSLGGHDN